MNDVVARPTSIRLSLLLVVYTDEAASRRRMQASDVVTVRREWLRNRSRLSFTYSQDNTSVRRVDVVESIKTACAAAARRLKREIGSRRLTPLFAIKQHVERGLHIFSSTTVLPPIDVNAKKTNPDYQMFTIDISIRRLHQ